MLRDVSLIDVRIDGFLVGLATVMDTVPALQYLRVVALLLAALSDPFKLQSLTLATMKTQDLALLPVFPEGRRVLGSFMTASPLMN